MNDNKVNPDCNDFPDSMYNCMLSNCKYIYDTDDKRQICVKQAKNILCTDEYKSNMKKEMDKSKNVSKKTKDEIENNYYKCLYNIQLSPYEIGKNIGKIMSTNDEPYKNRCGAIDNKCSEIITTKNTDYIRECNKGILDNINLNMFNKTGKMCVDEACNKTDQADKYKCQNTSSIYTPSEVRTNYIKTLKNENRENKCNALYNSCKYIFNKEEDIKLCNDTIKKEYKIDEKTCKTEQCRKNNTDDNDYHKCLFDSKFFTPSEIGEKIGTTVKNRRPIRKCDELVGSCNRLYNGNQDDITQCKDAIKKKLKITDRQCEYILCDKENTSKKQYKCLKDKSFTPTEIGKKVSENIMFNMNRGCTNTVVLDRCSDIYSKNTDEWRQCNESVYSDISNNKQILKCIEQKCNKG